MILNGRKLPKPAIPWPPWEQSKKEEQEDDIRSSDNHTGE